MALHVRIELVPKLEKKATNICSVCDVIIIIQLVLTARSDNFTQRVLWMDQNWDIENGFESHLNYHRQFRDSFNLDVLASTVDPPVQYNQQTLPSYFG